MIGKIQLYVIIILLALLPMVFVKGCQIGEEREEANNLKAVEKLRLDMLGQHKRSTDVITAENERLKSKRRTSDVKLRKLLKENAKLKDWWNTIAPAGAVDYIYGVYNFESDK